MNKKAEFTELVSREEVFQFFEYIDIPCKHVLWANCLFYAGRAVRVLFNGVSLAQWENERWSIPNDWIDEVIKKEQVPKVGAECADDIFNARDEYCKKFLSKMKKNPYGFTTYEVSKTITRLMNADCFMYAHNGVAILSPSFQGAPN